MERETTEMQPPPVPGWGVDARPEDRPGVVSERASHPPAGPRPEPQPARVPVLHGALVAGPTPVFGTAQPPRGLSGLVRRLAYRFPDHQARHWLLLLAADRVDVAEGRMVELLEKQPLLMGGVALGLGVFLGALRPRRRYARAAQVLARRVVQGADAAVQTRRRA